MLVSRMQRSRAISCRKAASPLPIRSSFFCRGGGRSGGVVWCGVVWCGVWCTLHMLVAAGLAICSWITGWVLRGARGGRHAGCRQRNACLARWGSIILQLHCLTLLPRIESSVWSKMRFGPHAAIDWRLQGSWILRWWATNHWLWCVAYQRAGDILTPLNAPSSCLSYASCPCPCGPPASNSVSSRRSVSPTHR